MIHQQKQMVSASKKKGTFTSMEVGLVYSCKWLSRLLAFRKTQHGGSQEDDCGMAILSTVRTRKSMPGGDEFIDLIHHLQMIVKCEIWKFTLPWKLAMEITNIQFSPISVNLFFLWRDEPSSSIGRFSRDVWLVSPTLAG